MALHRHRVAREPHTPEEAKSNLAWEIGNAAYNNQTLDDK
jgi:hypothetical protein